MWPACLLQLVLWWKLQHLGTHAAGGGAIEHHVIGILRTFTSARPCRARVQLVHAVLHTHAAALGAVTNHRSRIGVTLVYAPYLALR